MKNSDAGTPALISAKATSVYDVFHNRRLKADFFQREYDWQQKHVEQLLEDLEDKFDEEPILTTRAGNNCKLLSRLNPSKSLKSLFSPWAINMASISNVNWIFLSRRYWVSSWSWVILFTQAKGEDINEK